MITKCPSCEAKYKIDPSKLSSKSAKIRCKKCGTVFSVFDNVIDKNPTKESQEAPDNGSNKAVASSSLEKVYVCSKRDEIFDIVSKGVKAADIKKIDDGVEAVYRIINDKPELVFVDVDLPRIYGFEITELVRRNDPDGNIFMVLLGSIYNKNAYKRDATYAYGANKYIDHSKVEEELASILSEVSGKAPSSKQENQDTASQSPEKEEQQPQPQPKPEPEQKKTTEIDLSSLSDEDRALVKKAERKARIIAADIALYNEEGIREGLKNGDVYERIAADLDAGRKHFNDNIPERIREMKDFIAEEVEKMLEKKRKEFGL